MKLCPIFLFPSSSLQTIPNPHCVPYGLDTLPQHPPLVPSSSTSPSTVMSLPSPMPPEWQCAPRPVPRDEGADRLASEHLLLDQLATKPRRKLLGSGSCCWAPAQGNLQRSISLDASSLGRCCFSHFLINSCIWELQLVKLVYISHQWIKEMMRDGMGGISSSTGLSLFFPCKTGKLDRNSCPASTFPKKSYSKQLWPKVSATASFKCSFSL